MMYMKIVIPSLATSIYEPLKSWNNAIETLVLLIISRQVCIIQPVSALHYNETKSIILTCLTCD